MVVIRICLLFPSDRVRSFGKSATLLVGIQRRARFIMECPFYRVPEHSGFIAYIACIRRDLPSQFLCSVTR